MRILSALSVLALFTGLQAQPICDELNAGFSYTISGNSVQFANATTGAGLQTTYQWTYGDGTTANAPNPSHTYTAVGEYEVCLYVISIYFNGSTPTTCVDTACVTLTIGGGDPCDDLEACFEATQTTGNTVAFTNCTQPGTNTQYLWTFGDGSNGSGTSPVHTYDLPGTYTVCVTAFWNGCEDTYCSTVVIQGTSTPCDELEAAFTYMTTPNGTQFSNGTMGTGQSTTWYWTLGDGTTSNDAQPFHTYAEPGTYEVCLYAISVYTTGAGNLITCVDTLCAPVIIGGTDPCDGLDAEFQVGNNGATATIFYSAATAAGPNWLWDFGDGTFSDDGPQGTHTYTAAGTYTICLTVWAWIPGTQDTCSATSCETITVGGGDPCDDFEACFAVVVVDNNSFQFENCTSPGTNAQYVWTFGDGTSGSGENPDHSYLLPGTYEVCLQAYWNNCVDSTCTTIVVQGSSTACDDLEAGFTWTTTPNGTQFSNATTGTGFQTTWSWTFGDGTTSNDAQPLHTYTAAGVYEVCLVVVSVYQTSAGLITCTDEYCDEVTIGGSNSCDDLNVEFTWSTTPNGTQFTSATVGAGVQTTWAWTFGDGSTGSGAGPFHTYADPGTYLVCVTVTTFYEINGQLITCVDESCEEVTIGGGGNVCDELEAGFSWVTTPNGTQFSNATTGTGFQTTWSWTFGDGGTSNDAQPFHTYTTAGVYEVCLVVVSTYQTSAGVITCTDEYCDEITIGGGGDSCDGFEVVFAWSTTPNGTQFNSTAVGGGVQTTYAWSFGDGSTGTGPSPFHTYTTSGTYLVCVTATATFEVNGQLVTCVGEDCEEVTIDGGGNICDELEAGFTALITGVGVNFSNTTVGTGFQTTWSWTFGDGTTSNDAQPSHIYTGAGVYEVCLVVVSMYQTGAGVITCTDEYCDEVVVGGGGDPCDGFEVVFASSTTPNGTQFNSTTVGGGMQTTYTWSFGDGSNGTGPSPFHTYTASGTYLVCVTATTTFEVSGQLVTCVDEDCEEVNIGGVGGCEPFEVDFTYTVQGTAVVFVADASVPVIGYLWFFGDGTEGYGQVITHLFEPPGPYNVCLAAWYWNSNTQDTCWAEHCELVDPFGVGIAELGLNDVRVFPNPAADALSIDGVPVGAEVRMFSSEGRLVMLERASGSRMIVDVDALAPAIYSLELRTAHGSLWRRVAVE